MKVWLLGAGGLGLLILSFFWGAADLNWVLVLSAPDSQDAFIFFELRLPRSLIALIAGAGLAASGAIVQGVLRNPLGSPDVLGVGTGASLGILIGIVLGLGFWSGPVLAFIGALAVTFFTYVLSIKRGESDLISLVLAGLALNSLFAGVTALLLSLSKDSMVAQYIFRILGSLENRTWDHFWLLTTPVLSGLVLVWFWRRDLDLFGFGSQVPQTLGFPVKAKRIIFLGLSAVLMGAVVSVCGAIGFVGLMVPHGVRLILGGSHDRLIPWSIFTGAVFLLVCDTLARSIWIPWELPVGIITAFLGTPFFIFILLKFRRGHLD